MIAVRAVLLLLVLAAPVRAAETCVPPPELVETTSALPATAQAIAAGRLRILVGGSASVLGPGTSGAAAPWPQRLEALLRARHPGLEIALVVKGARGLTASEIARTLNTEAAKDPPALVLWQTGTVEAARGLDVDQFVASLLEGIEMLQATHADVVLVDLQFSRFLRANAQVDAYLDAMRVVAAANGVPLFRRYEIMQGWAESDALDLERAKSGDRVAATDRLNDCLARAADRLLAAGVAEAKRR